MELNTNITSGTGIPVGSEGMGVGLPVKPGLEKTSGVQTLTLDSVSELKSHLQGSSGPQELPPPTPNSSSDYTSNLNDVSNSTFDLSTIMAEVMELSNNERQSYSQEMTAQIAGAQAQAAETMSQASDMISQAWASAIGGFVSAGISIGMGMYSLGGMSTASAAAESVAGPKLPDLEVPETEETTTKTTKTTGLQDDSEIEMQPLKKSSGNEEDDEEEVQNQSGSGGGSVELDDSLEEETEQVKKRTESTGDEVEKLEDDSKKTNSKGFTAGQRDEVYERAYSRAYAPVQAKAAIGNAIAQLLNSGAQVAAGYAQASGTEHAASAQLDQATQQAAATAAQSFQSFFADIRSMINNIASTEFSIASKV